MQRFKKNLTAIIGFFCVLLTSCNTQINSTQPSNSSSNSSNVFTDSASMVTSSGDSSNPSISAFESSNDLTSEINSDSSLDSKDISSSDVSSSVENSSSEDSSNSEVSSSETSSSMSSSTHEHTFSSWHQTKAPSCTEDGVLERHCESCTYSETSPIEKLGHNYGDWIESTHPSCNLPGEKYRICARCQDVQTESVEKLGHHFSDVYTTTKTHHYYKCLNPGCSEKSGEGTHEFEPGSNICSICHYNRDDAEFLRFTKTKDQQGYIVLGFANEKREEIIIPNEYEGLPVVEIADYAFTTGNTSTFSPLSKVTFGKNIKRIGVSAFWHNTELKELIFPESLETIDNYAFSQCAAVNKIVFNDKLQSMGQESFYHCSNVSVLEFPTSLEKVGQWCFYECTSLIKITFKDNLDYIGWGSFYGCNQLKDADLGNGNLTIESYAFSDCTSLTNISIGKNIKEIRSGAFYDDFAINYNSIDKVDYLGNETEPYIAAIKADSSIESYVSQDDTVLIAENCFRDCNQLKNVTLKDNVLIIGALAFYECSQLNEITLGQNIKQINRYAFYECKQLSKVYAHSLENWLKIDFCTDGVTEDQLQYHGHVNPLYYGADLIINDAVVESVNIPNSVTSLSDYVFAGYKKLTEVNIGSNVSKIGIFSFYKCSQLKTLTIAYGNNYYRSEGNCIIENDSNTLIVGCISSTIPEGVVTIADFALQYIDPINKELVIPDSVEHLGKYSLYEYKATKFTMGSGLKTIDFWAFDSNRQREVWIKDINSWCAIDFYDEYSNPIKWENIVYVDNVKVSGNILTIPSTVTEIKPWAFANATIEGVEIPKETIKIDPTSFAKTCNLLSLTLDEDNPTYHYSSNRKGIIDNENTLLLCLSCSTMVMNFSNDDIEKVAQYAFANRIIPNVVLPSTVKTIEANAFSFSRLKTISLQDGLQRIEKEAFANNSDLKTITIPASVNYIANQAFAYTGLETAIFSDPYNWKVTTTSGEEERIVDLSNQSTAATELKNLWTYLQKQSA